MGDQSATTTAITCGSAPRAPRAPTRRSPAACMTRAASRAAWMAVRPARPTELKRLTASADGL